MGVLINSTYMSLDGEIRNPQKWSLPYMDDSAQKFAADQLFAADALLMGRSTYEGFAAAWPERGGDPFSDRMNSMPKFVVSNSLREPEWTATKVIGGEDVPTAIARVKQSHNLLQYGFGDVSRLALQHGLLDELRIWVHPILVGKGGKKDLLFATMPQTKLALADVTRLGSGVVVLHYRPAR
jgi:dihydrofolate reductase